MGSLENLVVKIQGLSSSAADISHLHDILKQADDYLQSQSPRNLAPSLANLDPSVHSLGYLFILTVVPNAVIYGYSGLFKGFGCIALDSDPLDDSIVKQIEVSSDQELKVSRDLIMRIRRRDLYQFCSEFTVPKDRLEHFKNVTSQDVICSQNNLG